MTWPRMSAGAVAQLPGAAGCARACLCGPRGAGPVGAGSSGWSGADERVVGGGVEPAGWGHDPAVGTAQLVVFVVELVVVLVTEQGEVVEVGQSAVGPVDDVVGLAL